MKLKKNWFSYVIWIVISIFSAVFMATNVVYMTSSFGFKSYDTLIGFVCLSLIFCFAFFELLSIVIRFFVSTKIVPEKGKLIAVRILVGLIFASSFFLRFSYVSLNNFYLTHSDELYSMSYYASTGSVVPHTILEQIYTFILSFMFYCFGKSTLLAVLFQFALEELVLVAFYILIRKLSSIGPAAIFLSLASVMTCFNREISELSVEPLLLLFVLIGLILFVTFYQISLKQYERGFVVEILIGFCGAFCGFLAAVDIIGWIVSLAILLVLVTETSFSKDKSENYVFYQRMPLYAIYFVVMVIAIFLLVLFLFEDSSENIMYSLNQYAETYFSNIHFSFRNIKYHDSGPMVFFMCVLSTMWFFTYSIVDYDFARIGALLWIGTVFVQAFQLNTLEYDMISSVLSLVFCVGGVYGIFNHQKEYKEVAGRKVITFEEEAAKQIPQEEMEEPDATMSGGEEWNQSFPDGRVESDGSEVLYKVPEPVQKVVPVIKIPKMVQIPNNRPELNIDQKLEEEQAVSVTLKRDMPEVASRVETPEKTNTPELPSIPKIPVRTPKKRLAFSLEDIDNWDYDITDIPPDDDFDLK